MTIEHLTSMRLSVPAGLKAGGREPQYPFLSRAEHERPIVPKSRRNAMSAFSFLLNLLWILFGGLDRRDLDGDHYHRAAVDAGRI